MRKMILGLVLLLLSSLFIAAAAQTVIKGVVKDATRKPLEGVTFRIKDLGRPEHVYQLLHPDLAGDFPPLVTVTVATANLPARAAAFIGRRAELNRIAGSLSDGSIRLLTLLGPGGTGKTALAIRAAEDAAPHFADGVVFVDLASARDTGAVLTAIARTVGVSESADRPLRETLARYLHDRRTLLVVRERGEEELRRGGRGAQPSL